MRFSVVFSIVFVLAIAVSAQMSPKFVSPYGNFEIELPPTPNLARGVRNTDAPDKGAGMIYAWQHENLVVTILYLDPLDDADHDPAALLEESNRNVRETAKRYGGAVQIENDIRLGEFSGRQLVAQIGAGKMITRNYQVGHRSYSLQAIVRDPADSPKAFELFSTFKLIDGRASIASKFVSLVPKPLPRSNIPKTVKSDLVALNINGRVAKIVEETEDLTGDAPQQGRILSAEMFYDQRGLLMREHLCDSRGLPLRATVYGYVGGKPKARIGLRVADKSEVTEFTIANTFDSSGKLAESRFLRSGGDVHSRVVYVYMAGGAVEATTYDAKNVVIAKSLSMPGADGNVAELSYGESTIVFRYDAADKNGNWTKRTTFERRVVDGKTVDVPQSVTFRTYSMY